jgi:hypothetical protein
VVDQVVELERVDLPGIETLESLANVSKEQPELCLVVLGHEGLRLASSSALFSLRARIAVITHER